LPRTRLRSRTSSFSTLFSACADLVHDLDQQIDERVGDLRCARPAQHREQRKPDRLGHARRSDGYAADGRARHAAISFSEQSENRPADRPSERTRSSLSISSSTVFRLGRPGSLLSSANAPAEVVAPSSRAASCSSRSIAPVGSRETVAVVNWRSNWARPEFRIRSTRERAGGSIRSSARESLHTRAQLCSTREDAAASLVAGRSTAAHNNDDIIGSPKIHLEASHQPTRLRRIRGYAANGRRRAQLLADGRRRPAGRVLRDEVTLRVVLLPGLRRRGAWRLRVVGR